MSIHDELKYRMDRGELFQVFPRLPSAPVNRVLLANQEINRLVIGPWKDQQEEVRCGRLWADFDRFIEGRLVSVSLDSPYSKPKTTYMSRLDPPQDDVFEIRSRDPKPGIRVFGLFADKDVFVAFNWDYRNKLGGPKDKEFNREREIAKAKWRQMFPSYQSVRGQTIDEYFADITTVFPV